VLGENICICVVQKGDDPVSLQEIRDFLKDRIAPHKLPDELAIFNDFPKLSGGVKIKKFGGRRPDRSGREQGRPRETPEIIG